MTEMFTNSNVDRLAGIMFLHPSDPPSEEHRWRVAMCDQAQRHTRAFNWWMANSQLDSYQYANGLEDGSPLMTLLTKLGSLDIPLGNTPTLETQRKPPKQQEWLLKQRFREILPTGGLHVGFSKGFSNASSFLAVGCSQCHALLHIALPYLREATPTQTATIQRHLANFLICDPAQRNSLSSCTAEKACPGIKHGDWSRG